MPPSDVRQIELTALQCPVRLAEFLNFGPFQILMAQSSLPEKMRWLLGDMWTQFTLSLWPVSLNSLFDCQKMF